MKSLILTSLLIIFSFPTPQAHARSTCSDIFSTTNTFSLSFSEEQKFIADSDQQQGFVLLTGNSQGQSFIIGGLNYTVAQNTLKVTRVMDKPEFYGQSVYRTVLGRAVNKNPEVNQILITLDQRFISAEEISNLRVAGITSLKKNKVAEELSALSFANIKNFEIFVINQNLVVSLIFTR